MSAGLKWACRRIAARWVEHRRGIKVAGIDPLQRNARGGTGLICDEVVIPLGLEREAIPYIASRLKDDADCGIDMFANPVCPVVFEGPPIENYQLNYVRSGRTRRAKYWRTIGAIIFRQPEFGQSRRRKRWRRRRS